MKPFLAFWVAVLLSGPALLRADDYSFHLNSQPFLPDRWHAMEPGPPWTEGEVIVVAGHCLLLGKPGSYQFESKTALPHVLFVKSADGLKPVSLRLDSSAIGVPSQGSSPLEKMLPEERKALRGLTISTPVAGLEWHLAQVDSTQIALSLNDKAVDSVTGQLPPLPAGLSALAFEARHGEETNLSFLAPLVHLRSLVLNLHEDIPFDDRPLHGMTELTSLRSNHLPSNPAILGKLRRLRNLGFPWVKSLTTVDWAAGLLDLTTLDISGTGVTDLSQLARLPALREISAANSKVARIGKDGFSSLRKLNLLAAPAAGTEAEAFAQSHADCTVLRSYTDTLRDIIGATTRLRIRSGGTCHRIPKEEKTLLEVKLPEDLDSVRKLLTFQDGGEPFHCMCCGDPSFEFYQEDVLVATLGFHHGQGMRWSDGPWPGDARLEAGSAIGLCDWLEKHGIKGAGNELREEARRETAAKRREAQYGKVLPLETRMALRDADSAEAAVQAFRNTIPDSTQRAKAAFSLYGCVHDSWNLTAGWDEFIVESLLPSCSAGDIAPLLQESGQDAALNQGLARWLFEQEQWEKADPAVLAKTLPVIAKGGLTSPRAYNRQRTILLLGVMSTPEARTLLRGVLSGEFKPAALPEHERDEPGGMVTYHPGTLDLPGDAPDQAHAAVMLLRLKDGESAAVIEKFLSTIPEALRAKVKEAAQNHKK